MSAGTITLTNGSDQITGSGTAFFTDSAAGDMIVTVVGGVTYTLPVKSIESDTALITTLKYDGPTQSGSAWTNVPRDSLNSITAQLGAEAARALRGLNLDKQNWQSVYSSSGDITVTLPDGSTFSGPSWSKLVQMLSEAELTPLLKAISALNTRADQLIYSTGENTVSTTGFTSLGRSLVSSANSAGALSSLGIGDVITESNSVFLKGGQIYKNNGVARWGWDFFGSNGEGMVWSSSASETMGAGTPAIVVSPAGGGFTGWAARGTALQVQCKDASNAAYSIWKAVQPGRAWIAGLDLYMPSSNVGLVMLHVNESNFQFSGIGDFTATGTVTCSSVVQTSDENKKHDIEDISNADEIMMSISGKMFRMNFDDRPSAGVIAQEIMEKFPVAVTVLQDGSLGVDYSTLHAPIIEAMKNRINKEAELIKRIEELEKRLNDLGKQ